MKTLKLIDNYLRILEQGEDLTGAAPAEAPDATDVATQPEEPETQPLSSEGEKFYLDLLVKAFVHKPTEQEINIVDTLNQEMGDAKPRSVAEEILKLLDTTPTSMQSTIDSIEEQ
jgi:hypothetical protein